MWAKDDNDIIKGFIVEKSKNDFNKKRFGAWRAAGQDPEAKK